MWIVNLVGGSIVLLFGIIIRVFKVSGLIAGYNTLPKEEKAKYDLDKLTNYVGVMLIVCATILLIGALFAFLTNIELIIISVSWVLFTLTLLISVFYMNTGNKFKK